MAAARPTKNEEPRTKNSRFAAPYFNLNCCANGAAATFTQ
jgi:hypothetical protein